jgi:hypothetical protein
MDYRREKRYQNGSPSPPKGFLPEVVMIQMRGSAPLFIGEVLNFLQN